MFDANSAVMTAKLEKDNSAVATAELLTVDNKIDIFPMLARAYGSCPSRIELVAQLLAHFLWFND